MSRKMTLGDIFRAAEIAERVSLEALQEEHGNAAEGMFGVVSLDDMDTHGMERFLHTLPQEQLELVVCNFLGFSPKETAEALEYKNIIKYQNVTTALRRNFRERRDAILGYN